MDNICETCITSSGTAQTDTPTYPEALENIHPMFHNLDIIFQKYFETMNHQDILADMRDNIKNIIASVDRSYNPSKKWDTACWIMTNGKETILCS